MRCAHRVRVARCDSDQSADSVHSVAALRGLPLQNTSTFWCVFTIAAAVELIRDRSQAGADGRREHGFVVQPDARRFLEGRDGVAHEVAVEASRVAEVGDHAEAGEPVVPSNCSSARRMMRR